MKITGKALSRSIDQLAFFTLFIFIFAASSQAAGIVGYWGTGDYEDVAVSGATAVCAATGSGIDIFDISNPANPTLISNYDTDGQSMGVFILSGKAYIADLNGGLKIVDISTPAAPILLGAYTTDISPMNVHVVGTRAYVAALRQGLKIIDISNPNAPGLLGTYPTVGDAIDLFVNGSIAYIVEANTGLEIVDLSNPASPQLLSRIANSNASGIWVEGSIACFCIGESDFILYDVSNPAAPQKKGWLNFSGASINSARIVGNKLYLADYDMGLRIVNIADPDKPTLTSSHTITGTALNLAISGNTALVASQSGGLNLVDITNPGTPAYLGRYDQSGDTQSVWVAGSTAFLAQSSISGTSSNCNQLQIIDISNPQKPTSLGHFNHSVLSLQTVGNTAFIGGEHDFTSVDITDPAKPSKLGSCNLNDLCNAIAINGDTAYVANADTGLRIIDISTPAAPVITGTYTPGFGAYGRGVQVVNKTAYLCCSRTGLHIIDVSNPKSPVELGIYDTPGRAMDVEVVGTTAFVADGTSGLQIINVADPAKPVLLGKLENLIPPEGTLTTNATSIEVVGSKAYITNRSDATRGALFVVDISDPTQPKIIKSIDISGVPVDLMVSGTSAFVADLLAGRMTIIELEDAGSNALFFPHADCNNGWTTEIALVNSSAAGVSGQLYAYDDKGLQTGGIMKISLNSYGRRSVNVNDSFTDSSRIGYLVFRSNSQALVGYTKFQHKSSGYRVALPTATEVNDSTFYVSHIASNSNWWTGIALLNTTDKEKTMTVTFSDGQEKSFSLAAKEHKSVSIRDLFAGAAQPQIDSAVITSIPTIFQIGVDYSGVVGVELFGSNGDSRQLSGISLSAKTSKTIYYPHVATEQNWWTGIAVYDTSWTGITVYDPIGANHVLTITPYAANGNAFAAREITLLPGTRKYLANVEDLALPEGTAWLKVAADSEITGFELFGNNPSYWLAGYTGVGLESKKGIFAKLDQGGDFGIQLIGWSPPWTGIALVNSEPENAIVLLTARNDNGDKIASIEIPLNPHERLMGQAETLFPGKDISGASYITYESNRKLVGFQINGCDRLLDAVPALKY